jgi:hypothetical protein
MRVSLVVAAVPLLGLLALAGAGFASDSEWDRESLGGVKSFVVSVGVNVRSEDGSPLPVDSARVQTDVELRLRQMGLTVLAKPKVDSAWLVVKAWGIEVSQGSYAIALFVSVEQPVMARKRVYVAETWSNALIAVYRDQDRVRSSLRDLLDTFENAYRSANPVSGK